MVSELFGISDTWFASPSGIEFFLLKGFHTYLVQKRFYSTIVPKNINSFRFFDLKKVLKKEYHSKIFD